VKLGFYGPDWGEGVEEKVKSMEGIE